MTQLDDITTRNEILERELARYRAANQEMAARVQELGGGNWLAYKTAEQKAAATLHQAKNEHTQLRSEIEQLRKRVATISDQFTWQGAGLYDFENPAEYSLQLQGELADVKKRIREMVSEKIAVIELATFSYNNSEAKGKKLVQDMSRLMLRSYNMEAENCVLGVKAGRMDAALERLRKAKDQVENLGALLELKINYEYHRLRCRELELAAQVIDTKQAAKEAEREERDRLREERKAQLELIRERERLEKEQAHYQVVLETLREQGRDEEAAAIEAQVADLDRAINDVDYRAANIRAGYVYVISNIGAFGPAMVKIGMTRRLEPLDRVRELGDASVPFNYDVHCLFFSENAVGVETELHHKFANQRVNLINPRREFFAVTPSQVKEALTAIDGNLLEFIDEPEAEQYRESQLIREGLAGDAEPATPAKRSFGDNDNETE